MKKSLKYITEPVPGVPNCITIEDVATYLCQDPHPKYRLVSCMPSCGSVYLIWEKKDER